MSDPREVEIRDQALEDAARIADEHWPESGHVHPDDSVSCPMSISILIRRLKSVRAPSGDPPAEPTHYFQIGRWHIGGPYPCGRERETEGAAHCSNMPGLVSCVKCLQEALRESAPRSGGEQLREVERQILAEKRCHGRDALTDGLDGAFNDGIQRALTIVRAVGK
jgi:hypothetical protein